jgi:hypothetical protein
MLYRSFLAGVVVLSSTVAARAQYGYDPYQAEINRLLQQGNTLTMLMQAHGQKINQDKMAASMEMQALTQRIIQANMQNPQVQAMYQQHRAQGGQLSFPQFAYEYAATGGFTPQGKQHLFNTNQQITARERQAWQGWKKAQDERAGVMGEMHRRFSDNQSEFGHQLGGNSTYVNPSNGMSYVLPHNVQPNTYFRDQSTGQPFYMNQQGQYFVGENGWWRPLQAKVR